MAARTLAVVCSLTGVDPVITRDTVGKDTPATRATSEIVGRRLRSTGTSQNRMRSTLARQRQLRPGRLPRPQPSRFQECEFVTGGVSRKETPQTHPCKSSHFRRQWRVTVTASWRRSVIVIRRRRGSSENSEPADTGTGTRVSKTYRFKNLSPSQQGLETIDATPPPNQNRRTALLSGGSVNGVVVSMSGGAVGLSASSTHGGYCRARWYASNTGGTPSANIFLRTLPSSFDIAKPPIPVKPV